MARGLTMPAGVTSSALEVRAATAGLNWYANERIRLTLNGILATSEKLLTVSFLDDTLAMTARLQLEF